MTVPIISIDFAEIPDGDAFENLVAEYFRVVLQAEVLPPAVGQDGGRDILATFYINDQIVGFKRKWVIQCKFYEQKVSKNAVYNTNIPTLIHEHGANGYLLVCKNKVTTGLTRSFENLNRECKLGYNYVIWPGSQFLTMLGIVPPEPLLKTFFPQYFAFLQQQETK